jgi:hypothetical protein
MFAVKRWLQRISDGAERRPAVTHKEFGQSIGIADNLTAMGEFLVRATCGM